MKKHIQKTLFILFILVCQESFAINYTWNGTVSSLWSTAANWTPIAPTGGPSTADNVTINGGTPFNPALSADRTVTNLNMSTGTSLNIGTFTLTITGSSALSLCNITGSTGALKCWGATNTINTLTCSANFSVNASWSIVNSIFNRPVFFTKSGGVVIQTSGGNTYNNVVNIINNSSGPFRFGVTNPDVFNSTVYAETQLAGGRINFSYNSTNNIYNGNITIASITSGTFLDFGIASGTSTWNPGVTIVESAVGFLGGTLEIRNVTQLGTAITHALDLSITVCCSSTSLLLKLGPGNTFNGPVNFTASNILLNGGTYNGATSYFIKSLNGSALSNLSDGGNIFNSPDTYISNLTSSALTLANLFPDDFNGNAHFTKGISTSNIHVAYNGINTFAGNIEVIGSSAVGTLPIQFGYGTGTVLMDGTGNQNFLRVSPTTIPPPSITRLTINKPSGAVFNNTSVDVLNNLTLTAGLINTSAGKYIIMNNGSVTGLGNAGSYISGPMIYKLGSTTTSTLNFPVGKAGFHRPAFLEVTHTDPTITSYTAELTHLSAMALGYSMPPTINTVSYVRYWDINREANANLNNASITLFYGTDDGVSDPTNLRIAKTIGAGTAWFDVGGMGSAVGSGSITSIPFTSFSRFALANTINGWNPLPIKLVDFNAIPENEKVNINWKTESETDKNIFTIERSSNAINFDSIGTVIGSGNSNISKNYSLYDYKPLSGTSYYRLKQADHKGSSYSTIRIVNFKEEESVQIFPNPAESEAILSYSSERSELIVIRLINAFGRIIKEESFETRAGQNNININTSELAKGMYLIEIKGTGKNYVKFLKN